MRAVDDDRRRISDYTEWLLPVVASVFIHASFVFFGFQAGWDGGSEPIKADVLDIADSNSLKKHADQGSQEGGGPHEVSNEEMVQRLNLPLGLPRNLRCSVVVLVARDGRVLEATVMESTGNRELDRSILQAVFKASPFPKPSEDQLRDGVYRFELRLGK